MNHRDPSSNTWNEWRQRMFAAVEQFDRFIREHGLEHDAFAREVRDSFEELRLRVALLEFRAGLIGAAFGLIAGGAIAAVVHFL